MLHCQRCQRRTATVHAAQHVVWPCICCQAEHTADACATAICTGPRPGCHVCAELCDDARMPLTTPHATCPHCLEPVQGNRHMHKTTASAQPTTATRWRVQGAAAGRLHTAHRRPQRDARAGAGGSMCAPAAWMRCFAASRSPSYAASRASREPGSRACSCRRDSGWRGSGASHWTARGCAESAAACSSCAAR
jgi:hypothetical protein